MAKKLAILYLAAHPIQNLKPYKLLNGHKDISYLVLYLLRPEMVNRLEEENINHGVFDIDIVSGYNNLFLTKNKQRFRLVNHFKSCFVDIPQHVIKSSVLVIYGHNRFRFWMAMVLAKLLNRKIILTTDIVYLEANARSKAWKLKIKPVILRLMYNMWADGIFVPSTASRLFLEKSIEIDPSKIALTPYVVDEDHIRATSAATDVGMLRQQLEIKESDFVFVFCAKFIDRKRPLDVVLAFAKIAMKFTVKLLMIGDGPLLRQAKELAGSLGLSDRIRFTGFVSYSLLPKYYTSCNCLVFCSDHEPFGLPVNEAMLCGIPAIVSDRIGCRLDLIEENLTGWIYKTGDIAELCDKMSYVVSLPKAVHMEISRNCKIKMQSWSSDINLLNQLDYFRKINIY